MGEQECFFGRGAVRAGPRIRTGIFHVNRGGEKEPGTEETALEKAQKYEMHDPSREHGGI